MGQIFHGMALNTTVWSYAGKFNLCILADRNLLPDGWELIGYFSEAFDEYRALLDNGAGAIKQSTGESSTEFLSVLAAVAYAVFFNKRSTATPACLHRYADLAEMAPRLLVAGCIRQSFQRVAAVNNRLQIVYLDGRDYVPVMTLAAHGNAADPRIFL